MKQITQEALAQIFLNARSHNAWLNQTVSDELLHQLYDLMKWGPTSVNGSPARILFIKDAAAKEKLLTCLMPSNIDKTKTAPVTAIIAEDLEWYEQLPKLLPHADYYAHFANNKTLSKETGFRNSSLQGAYLIIAARALGLDCGPMSGFDNTKVDSTFFEGTNWRSNFICNLGYGDTAKLFPRSPRLEFTEACKII